MAKKRTVYNSRSAREELKAPEPPFSGPSTALKVEIAFWIVLLAGAYQSRKFYWRVVFITAFSSRLLHLALRESYASLPGLDLSFANTILLGTWVAVAVAYVLLIIYGFFLTPLHVFIDSPMDIWSKYVADPDPLDDFRVHYEPTAKAEVEIIAIHGLSSNPNTTWASKGGKSGQPVLWLRDLLPKDPHLVKARIVQVNQQTRWDVSLSTLAFDEHAKNLLQILETVHKVKGRPIIFIAHSFGGLLLKKALLLAKQEVSPVATDTRGLLFLGVPHGGTEAAFFASLLSCTAYWRGSSTTLLHYMAPGTDAIKSLELEFYNSFVLQKTYRREILPRIVDFSEQRPERLGPFALGKTVNNRTQGILHGEEVILDTDHRGLNKFASSMDPNYRKVLGQLLTTAEYAIEHISNVGLEISPKSNVPFDHDKNFVPRHNTVDEICQRILSSEDHLRQALTGLGGMGKSQIAIQVSYSLREADPSLWVFWINAGSVTKFKDSYCQIAYAVGLLKSEESDTSANVPSLVLSWLRTRRNGKWVIILDGTDDMSVFYPDGDDSSGPNYRSWLPRGVAHGSILITTRNRAIALNLIGSQKESNAIITVDSMTHEQALQLLKSKVPEEIWDDAVADDIVTELEHIPLAISFATAYIEYNADFLEEYLRKVKTLQAQPDPQQKIHDSRREDDASPSVVISWQTSLDQIRASSESAAELLCLMSAFDNQNIPEFFIAKPMAIGYIDSLGEIDLVAQKYVAKYSDKDKRPGPPQRTDTMESMEAGRKATSSLSPDDAGIYNWLLQSDQRLRDDIGLLYNYQMISIDKTRNTYSMHSMVQSAIIKWLETGGKTAYTLQDYRDRALIEVSMAFKLDNLPDIYETAALHQNAMKVLQYEISRDLMRLHRAEILYHQAIYLQNTAQLELAVNCIKETIDIRRKYSVGYTIAVVKALEVHAMICCDQRRYAKAEEIFRDALEGFSVSMGFSPSLKNKLMTNLAVALIGQDRPQEAEPLIKDVVKSELAQLGDDNTSVLEDRRILGNLYSQLGDAQRAIQELRQVVAIWERRDSFTGKDVEIMIVCKYELLGLLVEADLHSEAERLAEGLLPTAKAEIGEGHYITMRLQLQYAKVLMQTPEKPNAAETVLREVHAQSLLAMEVSHPVRQEATFALVNLLHQRKKYADLAALGTAAEMYALTQDQALVQQYWRAWVQYAHALHHLERYAEAKVAYETALPAIEAGHGDGTFSTAFVKLNYAGCLEDLQLYEESIAVLDQLRDWRDSENSEAQTLAADYDKMWKTADESLKGRHK